MLICSSWLVGLLVGLVVVVIVFVVLWIWRVWFLKLDFVIGLRFCSGFLWSEKMRFCCCWKRSGSVKSWCWCLCRLEDLESLVLEVGFCDWFEVLGVSLVEWEEMRFCCWWRISGRVGVGVCVVWWIWGVWFWILDFVIGWRFWRGVLCSEEMRFCCWWRRSGRVKSWCWSLCNLVDFVLFFCYFGMLYFFLDFEVLSVGVGFVGVL